MDVRYFQNNKTGQILAISDSMAHPYLKHKDKWLEISLCEFEIAKFAQKFAYKQVALFCGEEGKND